MGVQRVAVRWMAVRVIMSMTGRVRMGRVRMRMCQGVSPDGLQPMLYYNISKSGNEFNALIYMDL
jgi:hypothetical protein